MASGSAAVVDFGGSGGCGGKIMAEEAAAALAALRVEEGAAPRSTSASPASTLSSRVGGAGVEHQCLHLSCQLCAIWIGGWQGVSALWIRLSSRLFRDA